MKVILIDPFKRTLTPLDPQWSQGDEESHLEQIYQLLDCRMIEAPAVDFPHGDILYCNEDAWSEASNPGSELAGFMFPHWGYAILGKALIIGNKDGYDSDCQSTPEDYQDIIWRTGFEMIMQGHTMGLL